MLKVGAGRERIDLAGVLPHDGFDAEHDPLHVRALAFENEDGTRACLLSVEATSMRDDQALRAEAARAVGCAEQSVWVSVTHTFSSPHVRTPEHLASDAERARNALLAQRLVETTGRACAQAVQGLEPAELLVAQGRCSVNVNRDVETPEGWWLGINPKGFSDHTVRALRVVAQTSPQRAIATVFCADVQSSVVQGLRDKDGRLLTSGDLAGEASRLLEEHDAGVALFLTGAAGDQAPRVHGAGALPELGSILAGEVEAALADPRPAEAQRLELVRRRVELPAQRRADFASLAPTRDYAFVREGTTCTEVSVARLGSLVVAGIAPEVDSALGARLRDAAVGPFELATLVNGAQKYLPSDSAYDRITYEAMNSGFARGAAEELERAILDMAREA